MEPVRHPALKAQDDIYASAKANQQLAQENDQLNQAGSQLYQENNELKRLMQDPNVDANVGGLSSDDNGPVMDPLEALLDGVNQGATLEEMAEVGMIDAALTSMREQGSTPEQEAQMLQQLDEYSTSLNSDKAAPTPYSM